MAFPLEYNMLWYPLDRYNGQLYCLHPRFCSQPERGLPDLAAKKRSGCWVKYPDYF